MAAKRKPQDMICMLCFTLPCSCVQEKKTTSKPSVKKLSQLPEIVVPLPEKLETNIQRSGISALGAAAKTEKDEADKSEREALTVLFQGGFTLERVGDPKGFESVRPMLNMSPVDIDITLWKRRRSEWMNQAQRAS